jgi:hypothetical protein
MAPEVFEQGFMLTVGGALTKLEEKLRKDIEEQGLPPETPEMEYLSFRSLPWRDVGDQRKPAAQEP